VGIDWYRMSPRPDCDQAELTRLVEQQANAFQKMPYFWATDPIETPSTFHDNTRNQHEQQYLSSSKALRDLLIFPQCDPTTDIPTDYPDLESCWRVYPITHNTIFPPKWRMEAHRTFLTQELHEQIVFLKAWTTEVAEGRHENYLLNLYLYETTMFLATHCQQLKGLAEASLSMTAKWANKPDLLTVRKKILALPNPTVHPAPLESALMGSDQLMISRGHSLIASLWKKIEELISLTRSWDSKAKEGWKLHYYQDFYQTFQQYLDQGKDAWLHSFFQWAERCQSLGFGLFLDY
jgi:hypothetical protein